MWKMQILRYHSSPYLYFTRCACTNEQASTNSLPTPLFKREALVGTLLRSVNLINFLTTQIKNLPQKMFLERNIENADPQVFLLTFTQSQTVHLYECTERSGIFLPNPLFTSRALPRNSTPESKPHFYFSRYKL